MFGVLEGGAPATPRIKGLAELAPPGSLFISRFFQKLDGFKPSSLDGQFWLSVVCDGL
jgi:hypothetical protein